MYFVEGDQHHQVNLNNVYFRYSCSASKGKIEFHIIVIKKNKNLNIPILMRFGSVEIFIKFLLEYL